MITTEFLLYLVTVILVVFLITKYYQNGEHDIQYKYIPITETPNKINNNSCSNSYCSTQGTCSCNNKYNTHNQKKKYRHIHNHAYGIGHPPIIDPLRKFDYDAIHDEFTPPFRRSYYDNYSSYIHHPALYPTYTRGPPGRFRKIGTLVAQGVNHNDKYKFLHMMGREKYSGRDYEYFAISPNKDCKMKFYFDTKGKEINDGDILTHRDLDGYTYKFNLDEDLSPKYDPIFI
jgi:hypothetical protein